MINLALLRRLHAQGFSQGQIATRLRCHQATVSKRLQRLGLTAHLAFGEANSVSSRAAQAWARREGHRNLSCYRWTRQRLSSEYRWPCCAVTCRQADVLDVMAWLDRPALSSEISHHVGIRHRGANYHLRMLEQRGLTARTDDLPIRWTLAGRAAEWARQRRGMEEESR